MGKVQINVRLDEALKLAVDRFCRSRGVVVSHFVQEALLGVGQRSPPTSSCAW